MDQVLGVSVVGVNWSRLATKGLTSHSRAYRRRQSHKARRPAYVAQRAARSSESGWGHVVLGVVTVVAVLSVLAMIVF